MSFTINVKSRAASADEVGAALVGYLEALPSADWRRDSDCAGWTVAAVVGHLVLVESLISTSVDRGLQEDSSPPPQAAGGLEEWREWRASEIARLSELGPAELLPKFRAGLSDTRGSLARLAATESSTGSGWHPMGQQPLPWFAGQWLVEIALHDWDIRVSADPEVEVHSAAHGGLGPEMRARMPRCFKAGHAAGLGGVVKIELDAGNGTTWLARLGEGGVELVDEASAEPNTTIQTDPGTYALVQTARRPAEFFERKGRWRVSGDANLAQRLAAGFVGY